MLNSSVIQLLKSSKNLLAFSAGVDSSALFFILKEQNIEFDIAIIDYNLRQEAKEEVAYAKELAKKYNKIIYTTQAPKFNSNFEANAREFRYSFFNDIIASQGYNTLLTAHQLNDKLEWFLMRFSKGAGVETLSGMQEVEPRDNYSIVRPLLHVSKDELIDYLQSRDIKYFIDKSNFSNKYERNKYRPLVDEVLLKSKKDGFLRSFKILEQEATLLKDSYKLVYKKKQLRVVKFNSKQSLVSAVREHLKELNYLISYNEQELLKSQNSIVVGRKWVVEVVDNTLYIAPYSKITLPKEIKERFRVAKIPPKIRCYLFKEGIELDLENL